MTSKKGVSAALNWLYIACLGWLTAEILVRRWVVGQIPTQWPVVMVYSVLLLNSYVLWRLIRRQVGWAEPKTAERS